MNDVFAENNVAKNSEQAQLGMSRFKSLALDVVSEYYDNSNEKDSD